MKRDNHSLDSLEEVLATIGQEEDEEAYFASVLDSLPPSDEEDVPAGQNTSNETTEAQSFAGGELPVAAAEASVDLSGGFIAQIHPFLEDDSFAAGENLSQTPPQPAPTNEYGMGMGALPGQPGEVLMDFWGRPYQVPVFRSGASMAHPGQSRLPEVPSYGTSLGNMLSQAPPLASSSRARAPAPAPAAANLPAESPRASAAPAVPAGTPYRKVEVTDWELRQIRPSYTNAPRLSIFDEGQKAPKARGRQTVDRTKRLVRLTEEEYEDLCVRVRQNPKSYRKRK
ncbi:hypothetical protein HYFRA_00003908 [Hymenoscyphus fraxineus]|uniref:Uncharacterized protein n=1 Tax=Hymenoscyphus fraxineus TaxID=746836 RepID=A0A9N9L0R0_9HELO|nr:hypothetical protein HYFRA_00003908 [Hymenoscyphus fraxineus]